MATITDAATQVFNRFDADKSGELDSKELASCLKALAEEQSLTFDADDDIEKFIESQYVIQKNANLTLETFTAYYEGLVAWEEAKQDAKDKGVKDEIAKVFQVFDADSSGSIDPKEFRQMTFELGETMTQDEAKELMKEIDTDSNGNINLKEFTTWFMAKPKKGKKSKSLKLSAIKSKLWARAMKRKMRKGLAWAGKVSNEAAGMPASGEMHSINFTLNLGESTVPQQTAIFTFKKHPEEDCAEILKGYGEKAAQETPPLLCVEVVAAMTGGDLAAVCDAMKETLNNTIAEDWKQMKYYQGFNVFFSDDEAGKRVHFQVMLSLDPIKHMEKINGVNPLPFVGEIETRAQLGFSWEEFKKGDKPVMDYFTPHSYDGVFQVDGKAFDVAKNIPGLSSMKPMLIAAKGMKSLKANFHYSEQDIKDAFGDLIPGHLQEQSKMVPSDFRKAMISDGVNGGILDELPGLLEGMPGVVILMKNIEFFHGFSMVQLVGPSYIATTMLDNVNVGTLVPSLAEVKAVADEKGKTWPDALA